MGEGAVAATGDDQRPIPIEFVLESGANVEMQLSPEETLASAKEKLATRLSKDPDALHCLVEAHESTPVSALFNLTIRVVEGEVVAIRYDPGDGRRPYTIYTRLERAVAAKPFIGGFAHRVSEAVFHHAVCQTDDFEAQARRARIDPNLRHRNTQTVNVASRHMQTRREAGVQAPRPGIVLQATYDRVIVPRQYVDAKTVDADRLKKVITIQCFMRYRFACRRARALLQLRMALTNDTMEGKEKLHAAVDAERDLQIQRRLHPQNRADFKVLLAELAQWRDHEHERIMTTHTLDTGTRQQLLQNLLEKEVKLLQAIDRMRSGAMKIARKMAARLRLKLMAAPKAWVMSTGDTVLVQDPKTLRARDLLQLHAALQLRGVSTEERLDLLLHVKQMVSEYDTGLTHDISDLIDRESDMLNRGRNPASLGGLRQRLVNLFYRFACAPEFNLQALL